MTREHPSITQYSFCWPLQEMYPPRRNHVSSIRLNTFETTTCSDLWLSRSSDGKEWQVNMEVDIAAACYWHFLGSLRKAWASLNGDWCRSVLLRRHLLGTYHSAATSVAARHPYTFKSTILLQCGWIDGLGGDNERSYHYDLRLTSWPTTWIQACTIMRNEDTSKWKLLLDSPYLDFISSSFVKNLPSRCYLTHPGILIRDCIAD